MVYRLLYLVVWIVSCFNLPGLGAQNLIVGALDPRALVALSDTTLRLDSLIIVKNGRLELSNVQLSVTGGIVLQDSAVFLLAESAANIRGGVQVSGNSRANWQGV